MKKALSLYIHIPFCKCICLYCNFLTFANKTKQIPGYVEALQREIELKAKSSDWLLVSNAANGTPPKNPKKRNLGENYSIKTIYFGGGTPSLIESTELEKILTTVRKNFQVEKNTEISIECNPESLDLKKIEHYKRMGITRLTLGIQSLDKKILFRVARPHDAATIYKALDAIKLAGFKNYGADFIIGLPHQTLADFKTQTETILNRQIPHLSFYFLSYDTKRIDIFKADCPNDDIQIEMYEYLIKRLRKAGYHHYEVSNFAKPGFESRHNRRYWNQQEYLGLGLGAHSYLNRQCFENERDFGVYLKNPLKLNEKIDIDPELHRLEYIMLHLRTDEGIDLQAYETEFGNSEKLLAKAATYMESGHMKKRGGRLYATEQGFLILEKITEGLL